MIISTFRSMMIKLSITVEVSDNDEGDRLDRGGRERTRRSANR